MVGLPLLGAAEREHPSWPKLVNFVALEKMLTWERGGQALLRSTKHQLCRLLLRGIHRTLTTPTVSATTIGTTTATGALRTTSTVTSIAKTAFPAALATTTAASAGRRARHICQRVTAAAAATPRGVGIGRWRCFQRHGYYTDSRGYSHFRAPWWQAGNGSRTGGGLNSAALGVVGGGALLAVYVVVQYSERVPIAGRRRLILGGM